MTHGCPENSEANSNPRSIGRLPAVRGFMRKHYAGLALGVLSSTAMAPFAAHAQGKVVQVQAPQDAWQVRNEQTLAIIATIRDPNASPAQHSKALDEFNARLTSAEKGKLTPFETMELFGVFYIPRELQKRPPDIAKLLEIIATQAALGWYDALRFADESGRVEIANNQAFFALPFDHDAQVFIQFMKNHPDQAAMAVEAGIQYAREKIRNNDIHYDTHWAASFGMLRMQCALRNAKVCEKPKPQPVVEWPALLDQAAQRVRGYYRIGNDRSTDPAKPSPRANTGRT